MVWYDCSDEGEGLGDGEQGGYVRALPLWVPEHLGNFSSAEAGLVIHY